jgi:hypothetical protein
MAMGKSDDSNDDGNGDALSASNVHFVCLFVRLCYREYKSCITMLFTLFVLLSINTNSNKVTSI